MGAGLRKTLRRLYYMGEVRKAYIDQKGVGYGVRKVILCINQSKTRISGVLWNTGGSVIIMAAENNGQDLRGGN